MKQGWEGLARVLSGGMILAGAILVLGTPRVANADTCTNADYAGQNECLASCGWTDLVWDGCSHCDLACLDMDNSTATVSDEINEENPIHTAIDTTAEIASVTGEVIVDTIDGAVAIADAGVDIIAGVAVNAVNCAGGAVEGVWVAAEAGYILVADDDFGDYSISDEELQAAEEACLGTAGTAAIVATGGSGQVGAALVTGVIAVDLAYQASQCYDDCINGSDAQACQDTCYEDLGGHAAAVLIALGVGEALTPRPAPVEMPALEGPMVTPLRPNPQTGVLEPGTPIPARPVPPEMIVEPGVAPVVEPGLLPAIRPTPTPIPVEPGIPTLGPRPTPGMPEFVYHGLTETSPVEMAAVAEAGAVGFEGGTTYLNADTPWTGLPDNTVVFVWPTPPGYVPGADPAIVGHIGTVDGPLSLEGAEAYVLIDGALHPIDGPATEFLEGITNERMDDPADPDYAIDLIQPR